MLALPPALLLLLPPALEIPNIISTFLFPVKGVIPPPKTGVGGIDAIPDFLILAVPGTWSMSSSGSNVPGGLTLPVRGM
jgi:hypothetical protein